jgi:hypothetical protein
MQVTPRETMPASASYDGNSLASGSETRERYSTQTIQTLRHAFNEHVPCRLMASAVYRHGGVTGSILLARERRGVQGG